MTTTHTILHQEAVLTSGSLPFESFIFKDYFIVPVYEILTRALVIPMNILHNSEDRSSVHFDVESQCVENFDSGANFWLSCP